MEESLRAEEESVERKVWLQYLFKALIGFAVILFFVGFFIFAFGYTAYGWSTVIAWSNSTSCQVQAFFTERRNDAIGRNVFEISIPSEGVYRQAAVTSMLSALYLEQATPAALVAQAAFFAGRGNATCFVPQTTIAFSQSRNVLGALSYYRVNSARNFIVLDYTAAQLSQDVERWRSFVIAGSVLIASGVLFGILIFLWWFLFLRRKPTHKLIPTRDRNERLKETGRDSYRKPK